MLHLHKKASLFVNVCMVGWKVLVRSMYGVVIVKFVVPPCLKGVNHGVIMDYQT